MSPFAPVVLDQRQCARELAALRRLLDPPGRTLGERAEILDFFRARPQLTGLLGASGTGVVAVDRIAYELDLFGLFRADAVIGDSAKRAYCLIEFEDAAPDSIFVRGARRTSAWSRRFDRGFDQIVDWFWALDDLRRTDRLADLFEAREITASAILVAGRDAFLDATERRRLAWRQEWVQVHGKRVGCYTYDEVARDVALRLRVLPKAEGLEAGGVG